MSSINSTEVSELRQAMAHRMPFLEHAEPDVDRFENLHEWVTMVELFTKIGIMRIPGERNASMQKTTDLAGGDFALQETEAPSNTNTRLDIDTVDRWETRENNDLRST